MNKKISKEVKKIEGLEKLQEDWQKKLEDEGFRNIGVWKDESNMMYADHDHPYTSVHVILEGEMILTVNSEVKILKTGNRADIPANATHSAKIGFEGCVYLAGEK